MIWHFLQKEHKKSNIQTAFFPPRVSWPKVSQPVFTAKGELELTVLTDRLPPPLLQSICGVFLTFPFVWILSKLTLYEFFRATWPASSVVLDPGPSG